jgi:hypothetical protein
MAMESSETPMLPYLMKGNKVHIVIPWIHVPWRNLEALNGSTNTQKRRSATHKLQNNFGFKIN